MKALDRIRVRGSILRITCPALQRVRGSWVELLEVPEFTEGVVLSAEPQHNVVVVRLEGYDSPLKMYAFDLEVLTAAPTTYSSTTSPEQTR